jgi:signal transduction histidine kinase
MTRIHERADRTGRSGGRGRLGRRLARLPLRARLVAGFTIAMTVVLVVTGAVIYWRVEYALDRRLDADLVAEADALVPLVQPDGTLRTDRVAAALPGMSEHQVLDRDGEVLSGGAALGTTPVLGPGAVRTALESPVYVDVGPLLPISKRPLRLLATPISTSGPAAVLVVGLRRDERDEALRELLGQLALAGFGALLITAVVGERLAKAALAPVERYRTRARAIAAGATGIRLDVPERRDDEITRLGHTLNDMLQELERSLARERRFVDDASHELRTPLTLLSTRVQLALRRPRSVAEHESVLRELLADITALTGLAEELLQVGAAGQAAGPSGNGPGDIARVVHDLGVPGSDEGTSPLPSTWTVDAPPAGTARVAMPDQVIRQVLLNLLTNAGVHGAPPVEVTVRVVTDDGVTDDGVTDGRVTDDGVTDDGPVVVLTVTDAGPGIPPEFLPTAAERFSRTDAARQRPGAGLGLSLVQALVERYDGELRLCSLGVHHRFRHRFDVDCRHGARGTTATVLLVARL